MQTMLVLMCSVLGGWVGWWFGNFVGFNTALFVSIIGSAFGWYAALRVNRVYR